MQLIFNVDGSNVRNRAGSAGRALDDAGRHANGAARWNMRTIDALFASARSGRFERP